MNTKLCFSLASFLMASIVTSFALPVPAYVPTSGLVSYYGFNANANDESGNGNNGTVNGASLTPDRFGIANSAYYFDGISNYIDLNNSFDFAQRSINIWVESSKIDALQRHIYVSDNGNLNNGFTQLRNEIMNGQNVAITNACNGSYFGQHVLNLNTWTMLTITVSSDSIRHYFNGVLFHISPLASLVSNVGNPTALLATSRIFDRFYKGKLDDLGIWNRPLFQEEITNLYLAGFIGIEEPKSENQIALFPNPAVDFFTISHSLNHSGNVKIMNAQGQLIYSAELNKGTLTLSTEKFPNGIYFVQWMDGVHVSSEKLFICKN